MDESNLQETLQRIDKTIKILENDIATGEKLARLLKNQDFIDIILEGYLNRESKQLFSLLTDPSPPLSHHTPETIQQTLKGISYLKQYLGSESFEGIIMERARMAPDAIEVEQNYRLEVTSQFNELKDN